MNYTNNSGNTVSPATPPTTTTPPAISEEILMTVSQPYSNHNAGWLEFSG